MNRLKVLIVSDYAYPAGGIEVFIDELILATKGLVDYRLLTWQPSENTQKRLEIVPTHRINCGDIVQTWKELDWADLLFFQSSWNVRLLGTLIRDYCSIHNKRLVTVIHTTSNSNINSGADEFQRTLLCEIIRLSKVVVGVSQDVVDSLRTLNIESIKGYSKYRRIENASRFDCRFHKTKERKVVSFIGRPMYSKGIDIFLDLANRLEDTDITFRINTVSMPPPRNISEALNIAECTWLLSDEEMVVFYKSTDLLVIPYRNSNGLPLTILEALSCGVPVVGFESPGVSEILNRYNQLVLKSMNVRELADVVRNWHEGTISIEIPEASSILTWKEQSLEYVKLFEEILSD